MHRTFGVAIFLRPNRSLPDTFPQEYAMHTHRFGRKLKLPSTIAIKHQIRKMMFEDLVKEAEVIARAEVMRRPLTEETRPVEQIT
jgi:hypothetical protein